MLGTIIITPECHLLMTLCGKSTLRMFSGILTFLSHGTLSLEIMVSDSAGLNPPMIHVLLCLIDYGINPQAQVDYRSPTNDRWKMPARFYTARFEVGLRSNGKMKHATFIFLDTSPCVSGYRGDDPSEYHPPPSTAPEFHNNIMQQSCTDQYNWLKGVLADLQSTHEWVIVVGHHPIHEADVHDFKGLLESSVMSVYLTGHRHKLQAYTYDGHPHQTHILSGAGCMVGATGSDEEAKPIFKSTIYSFNETVAGFTCHSFVDDLLGMKTDFIDVNGKVLYSITTENKNQED
jgi:hypothetical protein